MIKSSLYILSLLVLVSCASTKMTKNEAFLSISSSKEKIYILSILPPNGEKTSNYLSTLLVGHSEEGKHQFSAIVSSYYQLNDEFENAYCFIDSLPNWGSKRFPIMVQSATLDSNKSNFHFSMDRKNTLFESSSDEVNLSYSINYKRQKEFETQAIGTAFQLSRIEPLVVELKQLNSRKAHQQSLFFLHTLEKPESLFESNLHYYWLDFQIFNQVPFSVFVSADESGSVQVIYSTYPKEKYQNVKIYKQQLTSGETTFLEFIGANSQENLQVRAFNQPDQSTKISVGEPVQIIQGTTEVGNGIVYKL